MTLTEQLLAARKKGDPLPLSAIERPATNAEGYVVQREISRALGAIGGWKVGAAGPDAPVSGAPLPASGILLSGAVLGPEFTDRLIESEIAFRLGRDLPPRPTPYAREEILAAIGSCHPVIEVVQWRVEGFPDIPDALKLADGIGHGALIVGEAIENWQALDFPALSVTQEIADTEPKRGIGNPAGDMIRLIAWLADEGAVWSGGLKAGQIVTCGSWTGALPAPAGAAVQVSFAGIAPVTVSFSA
ncbi:MAG TPA: 2-keto-4-pentenoate hydratase [Acidisoma sp.]|uniref:2-keto-4-pentenoate hydratase n=1 Tax=Acidisoma sp. TaxID=1872115 RepID=UPI002C62B804|nr:2-keto-4-pentenoate hydratase [Acidisoma sp.]HTH99667.1 2-keto-4-pentenoate hydratase [Acidisoma sp.]